jgi:phage tail protein X
MKMRQSLFKNFPFVISAILATASVAHADDAPGTVRYTVQKGDTCAKLALRVYKDPRGVELIHTANPGLGPLPHNLVPGTVLVFPPKADKDGPDARLAAFRNQVIVQVPDSRPAKKEDALFRGNKVATATNSSADVRFKDDSRLGLGEETLVVILGGTENKFAHAVPDTTLVFGTLRARLGAAAKPQSVSTEAAKISVAGETQVKVDAAKTAIVSNYRGKASVTAQKKTVAIPENYGSKAEKGKAPTTPNPLPPVPTFVHSPPSLVLAPTINGAPSGLLTAALAKEATPLVHHVQVARDAAFTDLAADVKVPAGTESFAIPVAEIGDVYVRASAIDSEGFEGAFQPAKTVSVVPVDESKGAFGQRQVRVPGAFCSVDGGPTVPGDKVPAVDASKKHVVRCGKASDGSDGVPLVLEALPAQPFRVDVLSMTSASPAAGQWAQIKLTALDGAPIPGRSLHVAPSDPAVRLGRVEGQGEGVYALYVDASAAKSSYTLAIALGDEAPMQTGPIAPPAPKPAAPTAGPTRDSAIYGELGVGLDTHVTARFFGGLGYLVPVGAKNTLSAGARVGVDASTGSKDAGVLFNNAPVTVTAHEELALAFPFALRFGDKNSAVVPYISAAPTVAFQTSRFSSSAGPTKGNAILAGGEGAFGVALGAGPGTFFGEVGFRAQTDVNHEVGVIVPRAGFLSLGYRLGR